MSRESNTLDLKDSDPTTEHEDYLKIRKFVGFFFQLQLL
jgi:hypothetical protein